MKRKIASGPGIALILIITAACILGGCIMAMRQHSERASTQKEGPYSFTLTPVSSQKLAALNYQDASLSEAAKDSIMKEYDNFLCFFLEIRVDGFSGDIIYYKAPGKEADPDKKVNYYLFGMQNDLKLKNGDGLETPCTVYYCERMNTITRVNRFIVGFKKNSSDNMTLEYSNPYLDCGKVKFNLDGSEQLAIN